MHLNLLFGTGLPFGPPTFERYKDVLKMPPYRRVDIGFSYEIVREKKDSLSSIPQLSTSSKPEKGRNGKAGKPKSRRSFKSIWFSLEVYNLLAVNNVVSYFWVRDVNGRQYAVPNYLSNRLLNARIQVKF